MMEESMWGEIPERGKGIKLPYDYVEEQAVILTKLYNGKLVGEATKSVSSTGRITVELDILVPDLGPYSYSVLRLSHGLGIYPFVLSGLVNKKEYRCEDETGFKRALQDILSSAEVRKILEQILTIIKK
jgi:hypothetical protein